MATKAQRRILQAMADGERLLVTDYLVPYLGDKRISRDLWETLECDDLIERKGYANRVKSWSFKPKGLRYRVERSRVTPCDVYVLTDAARAALDE